MAITLPAMGSQKQSTKDTIISVLSQKWPLSAKEIYFEVKKNAQNDLTYQAVHKNITQLEEDGIIEKHSRAFALRKNWIEKSAQFFSNLNEFYKTPNGKYKLDPDFKGEINLKFDDISVFVITIAEWFANKTFIKEGNPGPTGIFRHAWWPTRFSFLDFQLLLRVVKNNFGGKKGFVITQHSSPFDKWILKQYLHGGFRGCKTNAHIEGLKDDFFIHGDTIFQVQLSDETKKFMDEYYEKISDLQELYTFYKNGNSLPKFDINVKIYRNLQMANTLRELVKKQFDNGEKNDD